MGHNGVGRHTSWHPGTATSSSEQRAGVEPPDCLAVGACHRLAYEEGRLIGEGSLDRSATTWTRHIGEIRLQIAPEGQRLGLGRILANGIDAIAKLCRLQMLTARMTLDQVAAQAVFRRLGFQREAVLWDYVMAADGKTRNLLIATKRL